MVPISPPASPPGFIKVPCALRPFDPKCAVENAEKVAKTKKSIENTIDFAKDPMGFIAGKMQEAASGLTNELLPHLIKATSPDFTVEWFVDAYRVSFGIAVALFGLLVLRTLLDFAGRRVGSEEVVDVLTRYAAQFFLGAAFGPAIGSVIVKLFNQLTVGIVKWGLAGTNDEIGAGVKRLDAIIRAASPNAMSGGSVMAIIMYALMLVGLVVLFAILIVSYVTLYISGSVAPIAWAWLGHPETKERAWKIIRIIIGLLVAKPVAFFMLAIAFKIGGAGLFGVGAGSPKPVQVLVGMFAAAVALIMAGFTPMMMNKMAPIGPTEASGASPSPRWGGSSGGRGGAGASSRSNGQLAQAAMAGSAVASGGSSAVLAGAAASQSGGGGGSFADKLGGSGGGSGGSSGGSGGSDSAAQWTGGDQGGSLKDSASSSSGGSGDADSSTSDRATQGTSNADSADGAANGGGDRSGSNGLRDAASGSGGSSDGAQQGGQQDGGRLTEKLAGAAVGVGTAAKVGASGLRSVAGKAGSLADSIEGQVDSHVDHAAGHGRRPRR